MVEKILSDKDKKIKTLEKNENKLIEELNKYEEKCNEMATEQHSPAVPGKHALCFNAATK